MIDVTDDLKALLEAEGLRVVMSDGQFFDWGKMTYAIEPRQAESLTEIVKWYTHSAIEVKTVVLHKAYRQVYKDCMLNEYSSRVSYTAKPMAD